VIIKGSPQFCGYGFALTLVGWILIQRIQEGKNDPQKSEEISGFESAGCYFVAWTTFMADGIKNLKFLIQNKIRLF
jgi:hypothetical protein